MAISYQCLAQVTTMPNPTTVKTRLKQAIVGSGDGDNDGSTTQLPAGGVLNTGTRRIRRKLGFGSQRVLFETTEVDS
ncbi:hypothetical protein [Burkholderia pseudomallei]|uniref:hypothetical protein n=1 Tax=Burkholderia pseudomallei TaxID=28450 RepID=UPI0027DF4EE8|nr:hypothetical protein [Burkholderia pseudomallei]